MTKRSQGGAPTTGEAAQISRVRKEKLQTDWIPLLDAVYLLAETLTRAGLSGSPEDEMRAQLIEGAVFARAERREFGYWNQLHKQEAGEVPALFWRVWQACPAEHRTWGQGGIVWFADDHRRLFEGISGVEIHKPSFDKFRASIAGRGAGGRPTNYEPAKSTTAVALQLAELSDADLEFESGASVGSRVSVWYVANCLQPPGETTMDTQGSDILAEIKKDREKTASSKS